MASTRTALARQYRPRRFGEMARQEHVSETLRTAVARGRVAHAYLFAGPRGVGKTTAARVLAMALNCPNRAADGEPCGECDSCDRIWNGRTSLDVVEIDAASNRGVDDARDLRERAMYAPTDEHRYKVYIIDEAHMLTREAWNALLKILEEPPPRVIFVFATTEPQKIQQAAPPILSRTQRFDFHRIGSAGIVDRLHEVIRGEDVQADEDALITIARRAEGGLRDALSLLDQVLSFTEGRITGADVRRVLGLVDEELYLELFETLAERRYADVFRFVQRLMDEGYDLGEFYRGLGEALRTLLIVRLEGEAQEGLEGPREDLRAQYRRAAEFFKVGDLLRMLAQVVELDTDGRFRKSTNQRVVLEALLLRFAHLDRTVELETLLRAAGGGEGDSAVQPSAPPATSRPASAPARRPPDVLSDRAPAQPPARHPRRDPDARTNGPIEAAAVPGAAAVATQALAPPLPLEGAYRKLLERPEELPAGLRGFLKVGRVRNESGVDVLEVPALGHEVLSGQPAERARIEKALGRLMGREVRLDVRPLGGAAPPPRLTPEMLKNEQLARLKQEEPALGQAVEEWDLELLD